MKSVLIAIQPYYVFLIIAHLMGWNIPENKTVEVRKNFPQDPTWDKFVHIYCSKNRKSFNRIPKQYQPLMKKYLGKVIGQFICKNIRKGGADNLIQAYYHNNPDETCLTDKELVLYATTGKPLYFWQISALAVYDTPRELSEYGTECHKDGCEQCGNCQYLESMGGSVGCEDGGASWCSVDNLKPINRPPQNWCYTRDWCWKTQGAAL